MLVPSIFNTSLGNDFFNDSMDSIRDMFRAPFEHGNKVSLMSTDIQDLGESYQMEVELPGYKKEDLKADLKDGYLTISAQKKEQQDQKDNEGRFVRRERYLGSCQRSFYVGEHITQEDVKANFEDGVLKLVIPKKEAPAVEEKKYIAIQ